MGKPTARVWFGVIVAAAGAALLFLGWYGVSGESSVAEQVPYLASASIPGAALLIVGAVFAAREREGQTAERLMSTLYELRRRPTTVLSRCPTPRGTTAPVVCWSPARTTPPPSTPTTSRRAVSNLARSASSASRQADRCSPSTWRWRASGSVRLPRWPGSVCS